MGDSEKLAPREKRICVPSLAEGLLKEVSANKPLGNSDTCNIDARLRSFVHIAKLIRYIYSGRASTRLGSNVQLK